MSKTKNNYAEFPELCLRYAVQHIQGGRKKTARPITDFYFRPDVSIVFLGSHYLISTRLQRDNRRNGVIGIISNGMLHFFSPTLYKETIQPGSVMEVITRKHSTYKRPVSHFSCNTYYVYFELSRAMLHKTQSLLPEILYKPRHHCK